MLGTEIMNKKKRKSVNDGIIINIASLVGLDPFHLLPVYTASKHAIVGFSRAYSVTQHTFIIVIFYFNDSHKF